MSINLPTPSPWMSHMPCHNPYGEKDPVSQSALLKYPHHPLYTHQSNIISCCPIPSVSVRNCYTIFLTSIFVLCLRIVLLSVRITTVCYRDWCGKVVVESNHRNLKMDWLGLIRKVISDTYTERTNLSVSGSCSTRLSASCRLWHCRDAIWALKQSEISAIRNNGKRIMSK